jgi:hypothetical protein
MTPTDLELKWARRAWLTCLRQCLAGLAEQFVLMAKELP